MGKLTEVKSSYESIGPRAETRLLYETGKIEAVRRRIIELGFSQIKYSDLPVTRTVYLASEPKSESNLVYARLRTYRPEISNTVVIGDETMLLEIKLDGQSKERLEIGVPLIQKGSFRAENFRGKLPPAYFTFLSGIQSFQPTIATEWLREHYMTGEQGARITFDTVMAYFKFDGWQAERVGISKYVRLECKEPVDGKLGEQIKNSLGGIPATQDWHKEEIKRLAEK